jgi:hypothetical protein
MKIRISLIALKASIGALLLAPLILHAEPPTLPPLTEIKALERHSLLAFNTAVHEKTFASFYKQEMASLFCDQISLEKFTAIFHPFFEKEDFDISAIAKIDPIFDAPPAFGENGALVVAGHYPTANKVTFKLEYFHEKDAWKLTAINVKVSPLGETPPSVQNTKPANTAKLATAKLSPAEQLEAGTAAIRWLDLLDAGKYVENFASASKSFAKNLTGEAWATNHRLMRKEFGAAVYRDDNVEFKTNSSRSDDGKEITTYTLEIKTKFEKKAAVENVRMEKESGEWKVAGYSITAKL